MQEERLFRDLQSLAAFTDTPGQPGVTRFSWSGADRNARQYIERELRSLGLEPHTDGIGNIRARMGGKAPGAAVMIGSHLDTVRNGGFYDGTYGVVAALEVLRSFRDEGFVPERAVEFIAFAEEEGSNFGCTCLGSKAVTGQVGPDELKALSDVEGTNARDRLSAFGLKPDNLPDQQIDPADIAMYLELHIEQGSVLEREGRALGIVEAISGMRLYELSFSGRSDHAASPMQGRKDPMAGFAEGAERMERKCREGAFGDNFSCTVGRISCEPDLGNVVPEQVCWTVDVRHVDNATAGQGMESVLALFEEVAARRGLGFASRPLSASGGVAMAPEARAVLREAAKSLGHDPLDMVSGPAHDAAPLGLCVPSGLLFVPSVAGLSHCAEEYTRPEDLVLGARGFEAAVRLACRATAVREGHPAP